MLSLKKKLLMAQASPVGQVAFTTVGTGTYTVPRGVRNVCAVMVGAGNRGGGGLSWFNDIPVTPGQTINYQVGAPNDASATGNSILTINGQSYQANSPDTNTSAGAGTGINSSGAPFRNKGGGNGGLPHATNAGGGAGGYSGNGGDGAGGVQNPQNPGLGGGGGGGNGTNAGGGGVGILGQGASGAISSSRGNGGSGGTNASASGGGRYGGGRPNGDFTDGAGAIRLIWGRNRAFPATNTGDL